MEDRLGNFQPGKDADFLVIDLYGKSDIAQKMLYIQEIGDNCTFTTTSYKQGIQQMYNIMFSAMIMGDDRLVAETFTMGRRRFARPFSSPTEIQIPLDGC